MECVKNSEIVRMIFKLKDLEKDIIHTSHQLKALKVSEESCEDFNKCLNLYQEGCYYFYQTCGFVKSQYFNCNTTSSSRMFLINNLSLPSYKIYLALKETLVNLQVDDFYHDVLNLLVEKVDYILNTLCQLQTELREI
jgi:hypothetical protein